MKALDDKRTLTISMRLLRKGRSIESALRDDNELEEIDSKSGRLFVGQAPDTPPTWLGFIADFTNAKTLRLNNKSCGSVLFLEIDGPAKKKRTAALTFGTGHHSLNLDAFERNFGLRVALNSITRGNLRGLDIATLDATTFQKRIQASRKSDLRGFGVDIERDLLRLASGVPTDQSFAKTLTGRDALALHTKTSASDIVSKCETALRLSLANDYKTNGFEWIDFVVPLRDQGLIATLDGLAFAALMDLVAGKPSDLHLALPDLLDPESPFEIGYFGVGLKPGAKTAYGEIAIEDYLAEINSGKPAEISDMPTLKASHEVRVVKDGEGDKHHKRKLYDCFVWEVVHKGMTYILFAGDWFQVDKGFFSTVQAAFDKLVSAKPFCASSKSQNEQALIKELNKRKDLLNLDQVKLNPKGAKNANLEPCDFFSRKKQFIHLKDGHSSAPISHLWNQATVSAESFIRDEWFRIALRKNAISRQKSAPQKTGFAKLLPDGRSKPNPSEYTVVFGILRDRYKKSGELSIPFFSKVSLRAIVDRLQLMGFPVEVHLIERKPI